MTQRGELGNKTLYQIIDIQLLAAQRLVEYMMKPKSAIETRGIVNAAVAGGAVYTEPLHSWLWFPIYKFTRQREETLNKLISSLNMNPRDDRKLMLKTFLESMSEGSWEQSSLNTDIMYELLRLLPQYKKSDPDPRASFPYQNMQHFFERFKEHAENVLAALKEEKPEVLKQQQEEALSQLPSTRQLKQRLFAEANKPAPRTVVVDIPVADKEVREQLKRDLLTYLQKPKTPESMAAVEPVSRIIAPIEEIVAQEAVAQPLADDTKVPMGVVPQAPPPPPMFRK